MTCNETDSDCSHGIYTCRDCSTPSRIHDAQDIIIGLTNSRFPRCCRNDAGQHSICLPFRKCGGLSTMRQNRSKSENLEQPTGATRPRKAAVAFDAAVFHLEIGFDTGMAADRVSYFSLPLCVKGKVSAYIPTLRYEVYNHSALHHEARLPSSITFIYSLPPT